MLKQENIGSLIIQSFRLDIFYSFHTILFATYKELQTMIYSYEQFLELLDYYYDNSRWNRKMSRLDAKDLGYDKPYEPNLDDRWLNL